MTTLAAPESHLAAIAEPGVVLRWAPKLGSRFDADRSEQVRSDLLGGALRLAVLTGTVSECHIVIDEGQPTLLASSHARHVPTATRARWVADAKAHEAPFLTVDGYVVTAVGSGALACLVLPGRDARQFVAEFGEHLQTILACSEGEQHRHRTYEALLEIGTQIQATEIEPDRTIELIVEQARRLLATDVAWLALVDPDHERMRVKRAAGSRTEAFLAMETTIGTGIGGLALLEGRAVAVRDCATYEGPISTQLRTALADEQIVSVLSAPLVSANTMLGALYVGSRQHVDFTPMQAALLSTLAVQASVTIVNAGLYEALTTKNHLLERGSTIHRLLTDLSLAGAGLDGIATELAHLVECDIDVLARGELLHFQHDRPGSPTGSQYLEPAEVVPIKAGNTALGEVRAFGGTALTELQRNTLEHGATVIALELVKEQAALEAEWRVQGELLEELLRSSSGLSDASRLRAERAGINPECRRRIALLQSSDPSSTGALLGFVRQAVQRGGLLNEGLVTQRDECVVLAFTDDHGPEELTHCAETFLAEARTCGLRFTIGVSGLRVDLAVALGEAQAALSVALAAGKRARPDGEPTVPMVRYEELGPLRFVVGAPNLEEMTALVRGKLGALAEHDQRRHSNLVTTLEAFLKSGGHQPRTAKACHIHISTLKYRLERISQLQGCSLADPDTRFELSVVYELLHLLGVLGFDPFTAEAGSTGLAQQDQIRA
jgi:DNA-binding PucR family transcriptional regulator